MSIHGALNWSVLESLSLIGRSHHRPWLGDLLQFDREIITKAVPRQFKQGPLAVLNSSRSLQVEFLESRVQRRSAHARVVGYDVSDRAQQRRGDM